MSRPRSKSMYHRKYQGFLLFRGYKRSWRFPREFERIVMDETCGGSVLQLYGGLATFGTRLDLDPLTKPSVIGNSVYPPFKCKSFDYVIVDPPFADVKAGVLYSIMIPAACIARKKVFWMHTHWPLRSGFGLEMRRWWTGSPGSSGSPIRLLIEYGVFGHPRYCRGKPRDGRKRLNVMLEGYDWSRIVNIPEYKRPEMTWQQKLDFETTEAQV